jgi:hypothetical protein
MSDGRPATSMVPKSSRRSDQGGVIRQRDLAGALALAIALSGCTKTTVVGTNPVTKDFLERRTPLDSSAPSISADLRLEGRTITGRVTTQRCRSLRTWTSAMEETVETGPDRKTGWVVVGVGGVAAIAGFSLRTSDGPPDCHADGSAVNCNPTTVHHPAADYLLASGLVLAAAGIVQLVLPSSTSKAVIDPEQHKRELTLSCAQPSELKQLTLSIEIGPDRSVPFLLNGAEGTLATIPDDVVLPPHATLPVVITQGPATIPYQRGEVIGHLATP